MAKMVKCAVCGEEIAKSAKSCPHCGAVRKKRHPVRALILLALVAAIGYFVFSGKYDVARYVGQAISLVQSKTSSSQNDVKDQKKAEAIAKGVTPELADLLVSYESFTEKYCEFIENYDPSNALSVVKYMELVKEGQDLYEKAAAYDEETMNDVDLAYYVETMARITRRLNEANEKIAG